MAENSTAKGSRLERTRDGGEAPNTAPEGDEPVPGAAPGPIDLDAARDRAS
ncbi:MAG TPA: hypothetical protein VGB59_07560 [Allosphingosinicella sp.]|jgi:hypothetical protein